MTANQATREQLISALRVILAEIEGQIGPVDDWNLQELRRIVLNRITELDVEAQPA